MPKRTHFISEMWTFQLDSVIVFTILISNGKTLHIFKPQNPIHHLSDLVSDKNHKPVIVVVNTNPGRSTDIDITAAGEDGSVGDDGGQKSDANDDAAYILYHLLRTTKHDDQPDPLLEETKQALRQAIKIKCKKVEECVIECPPAQTHCPFNCQQVFDNLNLCPQKPKRKPKDCRPKCGKTMPPKWFF